MKLKNALAHYYPEIQQALEQLVPRGSEDDQEFAPDGVLPALTETMKDYLGSSELGYVTLSNYGGKKLSLLDLTRNPATGTTKTFASLIVVARAVHHIRRTGERLTIVTPSSANKAVALRDAVHRAVTHGLVGRDELNIVCLVPVTSAHKLRDSELHRDPELRARNPVAVYAGPVPGNVKSIVRAVFDGPREAVEKDAGTRLWYTLQLENYLAADVIRAFAEADFFPPNQTEPRLHAHAVSSAYGLLGHAYGRERRATRAPGLPSRYFLVQHLGAPDMVLGLYNNGHCDPGLVPPYHRDPTSMDYVQSDDLHFPLRTWDPAEVLDPTFYTRNPMTSARMNRIVEAQGGGGIVVSLAECLERYGLVRSLLSEAGVRVPSNPADLREWSLVMAVTGVVNGVDRGLVNESDIVIHGSGIYSRGDFDTLSMNALSQVGDAGSLADLITRASRT